MTSYRHPLSWVRSLAWLLGGILFAVVAEYWAGPGGPRWAGMAWLLPVVIAAALVFRALWRLLGSRSGAGAAARGPRRFDRRRVPRDPKAQLRELRRWGDYWAVSLRVPPQGACDAAERARKQVFDLYRAPALPLPECGQGRCTCGYSGLKERRRRDVLPTHLERDRRAGAVVVWPRHSRPVPTPTRGSPPAVAAPTVAEAVS